MSIEVLHWDMVRDQKDSPGHIAIKIPSKNKYLSFWPDHKYYNDVCNKNHPHLHSYEEDLLFKNDNPKQKIELYSLNLEGVENEINKIELEIKKGHIGWSASPSFLMYSLPINLESHNCCTSSYRALLKGGINNLRDKNEIKKMFLKLAILFIATYPYYIIPTFFYYSGAIPILGAFLPTFMYYLHGFSMQMKIDKIFFASAFTLSPFLMGEFLNFSLRKTYGLFQNLIVFSNKGNQEYYLSNLYNRLVIPANNLFYSSITGISKNPIFPILSLALLTYLKPSAVLQGALILIGFFSEQISKKFFGHSTPKEYDISLLTPDTFIEYIRDCKEIENLSSRKNHSSFFNNHEDNQSWKTKFSDASINYLKGKSFFKEGDLSNAATFFRLAKSGYEDAVSDKTIENTAKEKARNIIDKFNEKGKYSISNCK